MPTKNAGDGSVGFWEGRLFDLFRSAEGRALVQQDRADRAQRNADKAAAKLAAAEEASAEVEAQEETVEARNPTNGATQQIDLGPLIRRQRRMARTQKEALAAVREFVGDLAERVKAEAKEQDQLEDRVKAIWSYLKAQKEQRKKSTAMVGKPLLAMLTTYIDVINVGDTVHFPMALVLAELAETAATEGWLDIDPSLLKAAELFLKGLAHMDPEVGLMSIFQNDSGGLTGGALTTTTPAEPVGGAQPPELYL